MGENFYTQKNDKKMFYNSQQKAKHSSSFLRGNFTSTGYFSGGESFITKDQLG